jgi:hypothetical protein
MRVIAIHAQAERPDALASGCGEESGEVPKLNLPLTRRDMLRGSGVLMGTIAIGSPLAALAPSTVWAVELKTLSKAEGQTLMQMGRVLYPHERLPDAVYALLAKDLDADAAKSADTAKLLREGVAALDKAAGGNFVKAKPAQKASAVKSLEGQPFFGAVRGKCITRLGLGEGRLHHARLSRPEVAACAAARSQPEALDGLNHNNAGDKHGQVRQQRRRRGRHHRLGCGRRHAGQ